MTQERVSLELIPQRIADLVAGRIRVGGRSPCANGVASMSRSDRASTRSAPPSTRATTRRVLRLTMPSWPRVPATMPRTSSAPARSWRSGAWRRPRSTPRTRFASTPTRSAIASCWRRCSRRRARTGMRRPSSAGWHATIRGRRPGRSPRRRSDSGRRRPAWASTRPAAPCGSRRATGARSSRCRTRSRAPATPRGAFQAATLATELLPGDAAAREALADAHWLADQDAAAFGEFRALAEELAGADRERVLAKARRLWRQHAGWAGRLLGAIGPLFRFAFRRGWLRIGR